MKIQCSCGATIHDGGDGLSHKAHVIPDPTLNPLLDAIDEVVGKPCFTVTQREAAAMRVRELLVDAMRQAWQCRTCGRLYIDDAQRTLNSYAPEGEAMKALFAS